MTLHIHRLDGCAPTPLAHYLKALAVLRLVSEQRDPKARGFWKEEAFWLATELSRDELVRFFLEDYSPTPILSPWNAGSGFYFREEKSAEKDGLTGKRKKTGVRNQPTAATRALDNLLSTDSPRLRAYRDNARVARALLVELSLEEAPGEEGKAHLIAALRSRLPDVRWLDASVTSLGDEFKCAPVLGSGANDGNEDFSKNFLERVLVLVGPATAQTTALLKSSLFGEAVPGADDIAPGQFLPAGNGGANAGVGFSGASTSSLWEYVLSVEGSLLFAGTAARRLDAVTAGAAFPFAVRVDPSGYASASDSDREGSRFEVWLPVWTQPADLAAVCSLLSEGRAHVGRAEAQRTTDVARAITSLGTSRGLSSFERTAFFTRNGNMHYSVPTGRWSVADQPHPRVQLLDDVGRWVESFRRLARDSQAPRAITSASRHIDDTLLAVCRAVDAPQNWQAMLIALGDAEAALTRSPSKAGDPIRGLAPLPPLRPAWLAAANDGSCELRLAAALASQEVFLRFQGRAVVENIRAHWLPIDRSHATSRFHGERHAARFAKDATGLAHDPDVVCKSDELERDCIALLRRRVQLAPQLAERGLGMIGARGAEAGLADVMAFLSGQVDDARILALAKPLMALAWWKRERPRLDPPTSDGVDAAYAIARITHLSAPLERSESINITLDPEPISRLAGGDLAGAIAVCLRRLHASGLSPVVRAVAGDAGYARRLAASLAFPIRPSDINRCANLVTKPHQFEESLHVR